MFTIDGYSDWPSDISYTKQEIFDFIKFAESKITGKDGEEKHGQEAYVRGMQMIYNDMIHMRG